jgi:hypothetical protein
MPLLAGDSGEARNAHKRVARAMELKAMFEAQQPTDVELQNLMDRLSLSALGIAALAIIFLVLLGAR